jgi:hypothetical protein
MDIAFDVLAQDKGELTTLKNLDEVEQACSIANEIVQCDLLRAP